MTAQTARLLVDGNGQIIPNQYYDSTTDSYVVGSATNGTPFSYSTATITSRSGTISTGGTAQVLMAANANRKGIEFFNNSVGSIWLNVVDPATAGGGSIEVRSGGYWSPPVVPVTAISVIGATTGQAFTCWEYA